MSKNWQELEQETIKIQKRFEQELEGLHRQGLITKIDREKYTNQVAVSKSALLETVRRKDLKADIQEEFFLSLIKDYQLSVQHIIDEVMLRLGADTFIKYKFGQVNEKVYVYASESNFSKTQMQSLESFMNGATAYALKTLPKRTTAWNSPKVDFQKMVNDYAEILQDCVHLIQTNQHHKGSLITMERS